MVIHNFIKYKQNNIIYFFKKSKYFDFTLTMKTKYNNKRSKYFYFALLYFSKRFSTKKFG